MWKMDFNGTWQVVSSPDFEDDYLNMRVPLTLLSGRMETSPASSFAKCVEQVFPSRFQAREGRRQFQAEASFTSQWLQKVEQQLRIHRDLCGRQLHCEELIGEVLRDPAPHCLQGGVRREQVAAQDHVAPGVDHQQHVREVRTIPSSWTGAGNMKKATSKRTSPRGSRPRASILGTSISTSMGGHSRLQAPRFQRRSQPGVQIQRKNRLEKVLQLLQSNTGQEPSSRWCKPSRKKVWGERGRAIILNVRRFPGTRRGRIGAVDAVYPKARQDGG